MKLTMREAVLHYLLTSNATCTATFLAKELNFKLSSLSSILKKMTDDQSLRRFVGQGPRGGYGYAARKQ